MKKYKCLYFDDEILDDYEPLTGLMELIEDSYPIKIDKVGDFNNFESKLKIGSYDILFLDIRIKEEKGGGIDSTSWQRTGIAILQRIRNGKYEPSTSKSIPIIVITAVADAIAQSDIKSSGLGQDSSFKFALFEKPVDDDELGSTAISLLN